MVEIKNIKNLLGQIQTIAKSYERLNEANGGNFNIFSILKMETDEVRTHSRFIAELLSPKGVHGFKDEFLKLFITSLNIETSLSTENSQVFVEANQGKINDDYTKGGNIDVLIKDDTDNVVMIENKIYAGEQHNQLLRYQNAYPNGKLLYLTLWGNKSDQESSKSIEYSCNSYQNDIINWLEECKKIAVDNPTLRETIKQYINLLKKLTCQNMSIEMNEELAKLFTKNEENFNSFSAIINLTNSIKNQTIKDKVVPALKNIKTKYEKENSETLVTFNESLQNNSHQYTELLRFENPLLKRNNFIILFQFHEKNHNNLLGGLRKIDEKLDENKNVFESFKDKFTKIPVKQNNSWAAYFEYWYFMKWSNNPLDLKNLIFGNFEEDLIYKIQTILDIVKQMDND